MHLKINTDKIPESGLILEEKISAEEFDLNKEDVIFVQPIKVEAAVQKNRKEVNVKVHVVSLTKMRCARCLEWYKNEIDKDIIKDYEISQIKTIDLWQDLREDLMLDYPMKPLCSENCKGLCSVCGQNLNINPCPHQVKN